MNLWKIKLWNLDKNVLPYFIFQEAYFSSVILSSYKLSVYLWLLAVLGKSSRVMELNPLDSSLAFWLCADWSGLATYTWYQKKSCNNEILHGND